ncbi:MAG: T9SS type A sorting domain-containing protein [Bacteroidales bacterium]
MNFPYRSAINCQARLMLALLPLLLLFVSPFHGTSANPDTTWSVSFRLNMTKAVNQHIFMPDSDYVYVVMDQGIQEIRLVPGPDYTYTGTLFDKLDSGATYHYKFRINDSLPETVNRTLTAKPGMVNILAWWNNEPLNITSFIVSMKYAVQYNMFDPMNDSVSIVGTMNNMLGSPKMQRIDTTLNYIYTDTLLLPGSVQQYKYRINLGDTAKNQLELLYKPNRIVRIPDTLLQVVNDYNNYNPAKRLMTFQCDMGYYVKAHHFDISSDYLDVAGNFNGNGANDALFDADGDTLYSFEIFLDTAWIHQGPLSFKFRINGKNGTTELPGKPNRNYAFHDTIQQNPNLYTCYFNNLDPAIPTPPWAYNVDIQGLLIYKKFLSGIYSYENINGIPEDSTTFRWLRSTNSLGSDAVAIDSATKITYVVDTLDIGKWLVFEVTPRAAKGDSAIGKPVRVVASNSISAWDVGISEFTALIGRVYPNPAKEYITVEVKKEIERVELINYLNQTVLGGSDFGSTTFRLSVSQLPRGLYLLKAITKSGESGVARVIKL